MSQTSPDSQVKLSDKIQESLLKATWDLLRLGYKLYSFLLLVMASETTHPCPCGHNLFSLGLTLGLNAQRQGEELNQVMHLEVRLLRSDRNQKRSQYRRLGLDSSSWSRETRGCRRVLCLPHHRLCSQ